MFFLLARQTRASLGELTARVLEKKNTCYMSLGSLYFQICSLKAVLRSLQKQYTAPTRTVKQTTISDNNNNNNNSNSNQSTYQPSSQCRWCISHQRDKQSESNQCNCFALLEADFSLALHSVLSWDHFFHSEIFVSLETPCH